MRTTYLHKSSTEAKLDQSGSIENMTKHMKNYERMQSQGKSLLVSGFLKSGVSENKSSRVLGLGRKKKFRLPSIEGIK